MDKVTWKIKYVPNQLSGMQILKPKMEYQRDKLEFDIGVPIRV